MQRFFLTEILELKIKPKNWTKLLMKKKIIWTRPVVITCSHCFSSFVCQQVSSGKKLGPVVSFCKLGLLCYLFWISYSCARERDGDELHFLEKGTGRHGYLPPEINEKITNRLSTGMKAIAAVSQKWKLFQNELVFFLAFVEVLYYRQWKFRPTFPNFPPGAELA